MYTNFFKPMDYRVSTMVLISMVFSSTGLAAEEEENHWSYSGEDGPQQWGELTPDNFMCSEGKNQSPIDLSGALDADLPELDFDYPNPVRTGEVNNGHTIQFSVSPGNTALIGGERYEVIQGHFHSPSEHSVNGKLYPMEIHLVHANTASDLAVIGVLFEEGEENSMLNKLDSFRPPEMEPNSEPFDYNELITSRTEYYTYNGSLTTPPCSEGVLWTVLKNPIVASREQIDRFHDTIGSDSNRPLQPKNARVILE